MGKRVTSKDSIISPSNNSSLDWRWFIIGTIFLFIAVGFAAWGFHEKCLSRSQLKILQWALPIASGFMAWTFAGSITTKGKSGFGGFVVFAAGGFAVFILTTYSLIPTITADPECQKSVACSESRPCVDIERVADFTKSKCGANGEKLDYAILDDTYVVTPNIPRYEARASLATIQKHQVKVYDLNISDIVELPIVGGGVPGPEFEQRFYSASFKDNKARLRYEYHNAFGGYPKEGIGFLSNYRIRNIHLTTKLPAGIAIEPNSLLFAVPDSAKSICLHQLMSCTNLLSDVEVELHWKWNMWEKCSKELPSTTL